MIDAYCSQLSYLDHLEPILAALPADRRGRVYGTREMVRANRGMLPGPPPRSVDPLLVAAPQDLTAARRPKVFVEHGAGQRYVGAEDHPSYAGGVGRERVGLFICPRQEIADVNLARYPNARAVVVGCPKLDRWQWLRKRSEPGRARRTPPERAPRPVVGVAFHWPCHVVPEAGWAFPTFGPHLAELSRSFNVVGTSHPRARRQVMNTYAQAGIPYVDATTMLADVDVLVVDNSSLMYEFAACDVPIVALNSPEWRRDVEHGLRFWSHVPGPQVDRPERLLDTIDYAFMRTMVGTHPYHFSRLAIADHVYGGLVDGHASERAAAAVLDFANVAA